MTTLAFLGDIHGNLRRLHRAAAQAADAGASALFQVGDCGWSLRWERQDFPLPVYWIDGNHETWPALQLLLDAEQPVRLSESFTYVPRGLVVDVGGIRVGCLGGASSVDAAWQRRLGVWNACETLRPAQATRLVGPVDVLVTHTPPQVVIDAYFDPRDLQRFFGLDPSWRDPSATLVERTWERLGNPPLYCGHMHRAITHDAIRLLDCDELCLHTFPISTNLTPRF